MAILKEAKIPAGGELLLYETSTVLTNGADFNIAFAGTFPKDTPAADDFIPRGAVRELLVTIEASHDSAASGVKIEESMDGTNVHKTTSYSLAAGVPVEQKVEMSHRYFRFEYTNGGTTNTTFECRIIGRL